MSRRMVRRLLTLLLLSAPFAVPSTVGASALTVQPQAGDATLGVAPVVDRVNSGTSGHGLRTEGVPPELLGRPLPSATEATGLSDDAPAGSPDGVVDFAGHLANGLAKRFDRGMTQPPNPRPGFNLDRSAGQPGPGPYTGPRLAVPAGDPAFARQMTAVPGHYGALVQQAMLGTARHASVAFMFDPVFRPAHDQSYLTTANSAGFSDFFVLGHRDASSMTLVTYGGHSGGFLESTVAANPLPEADWTREQGYQGLAGSAETNAPRTGSLILRVLERYVWGVVLHPLTLGGFGVAALLWVLWSTRNRAGGRRRA